MGVVGLTPAQVSKLLKSRGLKATPDEIQQLTQMMNADLEREKQSKAVDRFFAEFWKPVEREKKQRK